MWNPGNIIAGVHDHLRKTPPLDKIDQEALQFLKTRAEEISKIIMYLKNNSPLDIFMTVYI